MHYSLWQSEILRLQAKLVDLRNLKEDIKTKILVEEKQIQSVEEEMGEEQKQLMLERAAFQERQNKLTVQQVSCCQLFAGLISMVCSSGGVETEADHCPTG